LQRTSINYGWVLEIGKPPLSKVAPATIVRGDPLNDFMLLTVTIPVFKIFTPPVAKITISGPASIVL
jgi:hypothetical protein